MGGGASGGMKIGSAARAAELIENAPAAPAKIALSLISDLFLTPIAGMEIEASNQRHHPAGRSEP
jgi:hypothetical protein